MRKPRILLLTYGALPVPAVKGGAIETLLDSLIEENETHQQLELRIVSRADPAISAFNQTHTQTQIIPVDIRERPVWWFIQKCWNKGQSLLTGKRKNLIPYPELIRKTQEYLQEAEVDGVLDLNCPERIPLLRSFYSGKLGTYLHNDYLNPETKDGKEILQELDGVFSVCDFLNQQAQKIDFPKERSAFYRVNNGIQLEDFQPVSQAERQEARAQLRLEDSDCVIVFSGRITETKGVHLLLEALSRLDDILHVKVLVLGGTTYSSTKKDAYFNKVLAQAEKLPIEVRFTGYINKKEIPFYLRAADICAVPSIFHETCCLSAVEAQAMGIPVIATKIGGIPEYISEKGAVLIPYDQEYVQQFAQGLKQLIKNEALRRQMSEAAISGRERHSQQRFYEEFVSSIRQFIGQNGMKEGEHE